MQEDLLPQIGEHELEPSICGIVRSYSVSLLTPPPITNQLKLDNPLLSGRVFLVLANNPEDAEMVKARIQETAAATVYFWLPLAGIRAEFVTIEGKEFKLGGLLCRYLALELLLKQTTNSEELRRQLTAYPHEVPIRANNMNKLNEEKYTGSKRVLDIVERILNFDSNKDYQTDLLGENGTSEPSALIDGVLGANGLFIQRPNGWDIKRLEETDGNTHGVLKLIHNTLLRKREAPYLVKKLRDELIAPPYGIPACNFALFAAVAVRHEVKRLRWGGSKETDFAKNITSAFDEDSKLTIRLFEFSAKQSAMLFAVGQYFQLIQKADQTQEEFATHCSYTLRDFVKGQAESVKDSPQLQDKTRQLVTFFKLVGKNPQDLAEFLMDLLGVDRESSIDISSKSPYLLSELLADFAKVENARRYQINLSWQAFVDKIDSENDLLTRLSDERATLRAKAVADLLRDDEEIDANKITFVLLNKPFEQCDDMDIGKCQDGLETLVDYYPPTSSATPSPKPPTEPNNVNVPGHTTEHLVSTLRETINAAGLPDAIVQQALQELLNDYKDA